MPDPQQMFLASRISIVHDSNKSVVRSVCNVTSGTSAAQSVVNTNCP